MVVSEDKDGVSFRRLVNETVAIAENSFVTEQQIDFHLKDAQRQIEAILSTIRTFSLPTR